MPQFRPFPGWPMLDTTKREGLSWAMADFRLNTWMGTVTGHSTSYSISCLGGSSTIVERGASCMPADSALHQQLGVCGMRETRCFYLDVSPYR